MEQMIVFDHPSIEGLTQEVNEWLSEMSQKDGFRITARFKEVLLTPDAEYGKSEVHFVTIFYTMDEN